MGKMVYQSSWYQKSKIVAEYRILLLMLFDALWIWILNVFK